MIPLDIDRLCHAFPAGAIDYYPVVDSTMSARAMDIGFRLGLQ